MSRKTIKWVKEDPERKGVFWSSNELTGMVREEIGPTAKPSRFIPVEELPKTRSGKIMCRVLNEPKAI